MGRISETFSRLKRDGRRGLIPFITAGDPDLKTTHDLLVELTRSGAAMIELGVPFSDPMADGPVIQRASERALRHGVGVARILELVAGVRSKTDVPVVLFSYFNPLLQYGLERLAQDARSAKVDGVLVTDLAPEEAAEMSGMLKALDLDMIFLVAPTSTEARLRLISKQASGFIYAVSRAGVTGAREDVSSEAERLVARVREVSNLPVAVGFGISNARQVAEVWRYADAAVVGSAIVAEVERQADKAEVASHIGRFVRALIPEEVRDQKSEVRSQRSEVRGQKSEVRDPGG